MSRSRSPILVLALSQGLSACRARCDQPELPYDGLDNDCDPDTPDDDLDGDGHTRDDDCDDQVAARWEPERREGEYLWYQWDVDGWCESACPVDVAGSLILGTGDGERFEPIESLAGLHCLRSVSDSFIIGWENQVESLAGLERLEEVGDELDLYDLQIEDLRGLDALRSVGTLEISECYFLDSLEGAPALREVRETLALEDSYRPVDFEPVRDIDEIGGLYLHIYDLTDLEFIGRRRAFEHGLNLSLFADTSLEVFSELETVGGDVKLRTFERQDFAGLGALREVGGDMNIEANAVATSLRGLESLEVVQGELLITANHALRSLAGLEGLRRVGALTVQDNDGIVALDAVYGLEEVAGNLVVRQNAALGPREALALVSQVERIGGDMILEDNGDSPEVGP